MRYWKLSLVVLGCLVVGACGSSSKAKVTVIVGPTLVNVPLLQTVQFTASVGGATDQTVVWKVNDVVGGNATTGTISTGGLYTAPAAIPTPATVTIKATSNADSTVSGTATVGLTSGVVLTLKPLTATVGTGETLLFTATVTGNTNTGVNWFVNGTAGGALATTGSITTMTTGGAPATYTAPATIPTGGSVTVKAVSAVDTNQMATATVTIVTAANPTLSSINPTHAAAGSVFQDFYLTGTNFLSSSQVLIGSTPVPTTLLSATLLRARAPASVLSSPGIRTVIVQRQNGALTSSLNIAVDSVRPALVSALPESSPVTASTVTYTFQGGFYGSGVFGEFQGTPQTSTPVTPQQLQVTLGAGALMTPGLFEVGVKNPAATPSISAVNIALQPVMSPAVTNTIGAGVLNQPQAIAVDTSLGIAAVVNGGTSGMNANSLSLIDVVSQTIIATIPVGMAPKTVAADNERDLALVADNASSDIAVVNLVTHAVTILSAPGTTLFTNAYGVGVDSIHGLALVANQSTNSATIIDLTTLPAGSPATAVCDVPPVAGHVLCTTVGISTGTAPQVAVLPQLGWAIVTPGGGAGSLSVVDLVNRSVVFTSTVNLSTRGVAVNTETEKLLLADPGSSFVSVFSLQDQAVSTVNLGLNNVAVAVNPLTNVGVVVNQSTNSVTLVDMLAPAALGTPVTVGTNPQAVAIDPGTDTALVANQSANTISIINLGAVTPNPQIVQMDPAVIFTSGASVPLTLIGEGFLPGAQVRFNQMTPVAATVSANGRKITATIPAALVSQANRLVVDVQNPANVFSNVENLLVIQPVPVGTAPQGVAIDPERNVAVVTNKGSNNITVVDMNTGNVLSTFSVGTNPTAVAVLSRTGQAVVANEGSGSASIVDLSGVAATVTVATGGQPHGVAINPDSGYAYVSNAASNSLSAFLITGTGTPVSTAIAVDVKPGAMAVAPELSALALAHETSNDVLVLDLTAPATPTIRSRVSGINFPTGVTYDPVSQLFMAISSLGNNLEVIDPVAGRLIPPPVRVGINPTSLGYNFQTSTLLTANTGSNTLSVMDFPNRRVRSVLALNLNSTFQFAVDIHPRTNIAAIVDTANNRLLLVPMPR